MKIAIQNPDLLFREQSKNFNGFDFAFLINHTDIIYVTSWKRFLYYVYKLMKNKINPLKFKFIFNIIKLNERADILISFNEPLYLDKYQPPKDFSGLKIWHTMDYVYKASESAKILKNANVDYLIGYTRQDIYGNFYKYYFRNFIGKTIPLPFGYGNRFICKNSFKNRINKVIALGSVNPVNDPLVKNGDLDEYITFHDGIIWTHTFRQIIRENIDSFRDIVDSKLPIPPSTKNPFYDPVEELNKYTMFINDEGIMNFPPARTYEGIACGCVMVASKNPIYEDLGFIDGVNYIGFEKNSLEDFRKKVEYYIVHPDKLQVIQKNSLELAKNYTHEKVAAKLYEDIEKLYMERTK